eukprot:360322-Chlamydomonas_euryale.AAC.6
MKSCAGPGGDRRRAWEGSLAALRRSTAPNTFLKYVASAATPQVIQSDVDEALRLMRMSKVGGNELWSMGVTWRVTSPRHVRFWKRLPDFQRTIQNHVERTIQTTLASCWHPRVGELGRRTTDESHLPQSCFLSSTLHTHISTPRAVPHTQSSLATEIEHVRREDNISVCYKLIREEAARAGGGGGAAAAGEVTVGWARILEITSKYNISREDILSCIQVRAADGKGWAWLGAGALRPTGDDRHDLRAEPCSQQETIGMT